MNPLTKAWRNLLKGGFTGGAGGGGKAEGGQGRLPPVPLGWRAGGVPGVAGRLPPSMVASVQASPAATATPMTPVAPMSPITPVDPVIASEAETAAEGTPTPSMSEVKVRVSSRPVPTLARAVAGASPDRNEARAPFPVARPTTQVRATETDVTMMAKALELAKQALALGEVPIGAVVYETATGKILGEGYNRREVDKDPSAHAEWFAIKEASEKVGDWRLNHCTLVVTLEPCVMCSGLIVNARIGRLVYGPRDPKAGGAESLFRLTNDPRLNHRVEPISEVMQPECARLLGEFFKVLRAKKG